MLMRGRSDAAYTFHPSRAEAFMGRANFVLWLSIVWLVVVSGAMFFIVFALY
jgi:hypothetical protein